MRLCVSSWRRFAEAVAAGNGIWPEAVWDGEAFAHGTISVILFTPRRTDYQTSHRQDELCIVMAGSGVLLAEDVRHVFAAGDVLYVPAEKVHRFVEFKQDLITWAVFWVR